MIFDISHLSVRYISYNPSEIFEKSKKKSELEIGFIIGEIMEMKGGGLRYVCVGVCFRFLSKVDVALKSRNEYSRQGFSCGDILPNLIRAIGWAVINLEI